jgi:hypothetical protein
METIPLDVENTTRDEDTCKSFRKEDYRRAADQAGGRLKNRSAYKTGKRCNNKGNNAVRSGRNESRLGHGVSFEN